VPFSRTLPNTEKRKQTENNTESTFAWFQHNACGLTA
jgi:hypothetical protein